MRLETLAVHAGAQIDPETGAVSPPIHLSTTFEHPADAALNTGYIYGRYGNPTQDRLETALAAAGRAGAGRGGVRAPARVRAAGGGRVHERRFAARAAVARVFAVGVERL